MDQRMVTVPLWVLKDLLELGRDHAKDTIETNAVAYADLIVGPFVDSEIERESITDLEDEITLRLRQAMFRSGWTDCGDRKAVLDGARDDHFGPGHPARVALRELLSNPNDRISSLIRYNSQEVIRRRVAEARLRVALTALQKARDTFTEYGALHRAKDTVDGSMKALRNDTLAGEMDEAMTFDPDPADYGRA